MGEDGGWQKEHHLVARRKAPRDLHSLSLTSHVRTAVLSSFHAAPCRALTWCSMCPFLRLLCWRVSLPDLDLAILSHLPLPLPLQDPALTSRSLQTPPCDSNQQRTLLRPGLSLSVPPRSQRPRENCGRDARDFQVLHA